MSDENKEILDQVTELISSKKEISKEKSKRFRKISKIEKTIQEESLENSHENFS